MKAAKRWRCVRCSRDKFDRPYKPHLCLGQYRKKLPPFEPVPCQDLKAML